MDERIQRKVEKLEQQCQKEAKEFAKKVQELQKSNQVNPKGRVCASFQSSFNISWYRVLLFEIRIKRVWLQFLLSKGDYLHVPLMSVSSAGSGESSR